MSLSKNTVEGKENYWKTIAYGIYRTRVGKGLLRRRRRYITQEGPTTKELRNGDWLYKPRPDLKTFWWLRRMKSPR